MTVYIPAPEVLPEYTDEALREERAHKGEVARSLLSVPDVYRQPVMAEVHQRSTVTRYTTSRGGLMEAAIEQVADFDKTRRQVIAEVLAQLAKETP